MKISSARQRSNQEWFKTLLVIFLLFLSACAEGTPPAEFTQSPSLIPANTPTGVPSETADPALVALPTIFFGNTPIPSSSRTPFATNTPYPGSPEPGCIAIASEEGIRLNPGPFVSAYQLRPTFELGVRYQVIDRFGTFLQFARDGVPVGWAELPIYTGGYSTEGAGCADTVDRASDTRALTDFDGLCFFKAKRPTETFQDRALTMPFFIKLAPSPDAFVVLWRSRKSIFTSLSHAGPSFHVPAENVSLFGDCARIPTSATVTTAGWLWSASDERQGEKLMRLTAGTHLHVEGDRPPDSNGQAARVQAVFEQQGQRVSGWVWSALLTFD